MLLLPPQENNHLKSPDLISWGIHQKRIRQTPMNCLLIVEVGAAVLREGERNQFYSQRTYGQPEELDVKKQNAPVHVYLPTLSRKGTHLHEDID